MSKWNDDYYGSEVDDLNNLKKLWINDLKITKNDPKLTYNEIK